MSGFDSIASAMGDAKNEWEESPLFFLFEGWDVAERTQATLDQAVADGKDLENADLSRHVGKGPHDFQNGYILSTKFFRAVMAANQLGKSVAVMIEIIMRATAMIPLTYRYDKGYDTGVKRLKSVVNVRRFGRRDIETGKIIDHDETISDNGTWDCGTVKGAGKFPNSKIVKEGSSIRLGSTQKNILENWWVVFTGQKKDGMGEFMPKGAVDLGKGSFRTKGANKNDNQIFFKRNVTLQFISYESGKEKFEGIEVPTYLDEEPKDEGVIGSVVTHCTDWSLTETPYFGITYSERLIFPKKRSSSMQTFHASAYDCPYKTKQKILDQRATLDATPWEIGARIWGLPSEQQGKPYYNRAKINLWIQRYNVPYKMVRFTPVEDWLGINTNKNITHLKGLMDVDIKCEEVDFDDKKATWFIYEDLKDGVGYVSASDQADGAELVEDVGDWSACVIGRQKDVVEDPLSPIVCATLRSSLPAVQFAREVMYASRWYNNALLAPESGKGAANATFEATATDWKYWFKDTIEKWSTRKPKENRGFCPTSDRRELIYAKLLRDWMDKFTETDYPQIPDNIILNELASAIVGKTKGGTATRCDHPPNGTLDSATAYGILHFVMQEHFIKQIRCNSGKMKKQRNLTWLEVAEARVNKVPEKPCLGGVVKKFR